MKCVMFRILPRGIQTEISTWLLFQITVRTFARTLCSESGLENNICHPRRSKICQWTWGLQKYFSSGQLDSRWSRLFAGFCLCSLDMQPVWSLRARSSLGQEKLLKSHHSGEWTGSASQPGAHSQLNPCSNATTLQLEPSRLTRRKYSVFAI